MLLRRFYYHVKPLLPARFRYALRRRLAAGQLKRNGFNWPIDEGAGTPPSNWLGWPTGKEFAFILTHDVEGMEGLRKCRRLAELELKLGFRSSFNFVPEGEYHVPQDLRSYLTQNGFEVGVHDLHHDGHLYSSREAFRTKAARINGYLKEWGAVGFRSGFMHHNYEWLHDLEVLYDASSFDTDPFEPQPDAVRTIFPFWMPGEEGRGYVELPYTLPQDSTLFLILQEKTDAIWRKKLAWIRARGGMALLNVHPDYIAFDSNRPLRVDEYPVQLYQQFLEHVRHTYRGCMWETLPRELATYVRSGINSQTALLSNNHAAKDQMI